MHETIAACMDSKRGRIVIGLMSGTSADGVDAVACEIRGRGITVRARVLSHAHRTYTKQLRSAVLSAAAGDVRGAAWFCRLNWRVGHAFADAAQRAARAAGLAPDDVDLIGSHGQTICHLPPAAATPISGTWQIGEPAVIAARLGAPVVARFREADIAAGGQGAPLVPWTDFVLFRHGRQNRAIQNIGGIANLTYLPAGAAPSDIRAFDSGPGNMVIDALAAQLSGGKMQFDRDGRLAARGRVHSPLLKHWLSHAYFSRRPPKSCGREQFGAEFIAAGLRRYARRLAVHDILATATMLTARTIADAYVCFLPQRRTRAAVDEIVLCGGGALNATLQRMLADLMPGVRFRSIDEFGIAVQAKEALSFALLACACVDGVPAGLPAVTGARRAAVLGQIVPPNRMPRRP